MAYRVTESEVAAIIPYTGDVSVLTSFIADAEVILNARVPVGGYSEEYLTVMEKYLAAHLYLLLTTPMKSQTIGKSAESYDVKSDLGLNLTRPGQQVQWLDTKNYLKPTKPQVVQWLGTDNCRSPTP